MAILFSTRTAAALGLLLMGSWTAACSSSKSVEAGSAQPHKDRKAAPDFALKDADGKTVRLSDYRGKVVLLDFWATWCGPCKIEIPWFMEFQRKHKDRGFEVLGVAMDDEGWDAVKPFINHFGINYRVVLGNEDVSASYGGVEALPTTFLIDRQGRIAAKHEGVAARSSFEDGINELLEESGSGRVSLSAFAVRAR